MKFVDEVVITVQGGKGGDGCCSFRREKYVEMGGPNGGNAGKGGDIYLEAKDELNTLVDFRYQRIFKSQKGQNGLGKDCTGYSGDDLIIPVPLGTLVFDHDTTELIADLTTVGQKILVAKGGDRGLGNAHFKTSTNRAPRKFTRGKPGEERRLRLELKLLADVGLLGLPNAGKSTLIRSVSAAEPKVADYPFTTLHPHLGVVRMGAYKSFVMADIPGIIEGASHGAGLGFLFLKHLMRTKLLLHVIDVLPPEGTSPTLNARLLEKELSLYSSELAQKPRWLVLNKLDLIPESEQEPLVKQILADLNWTGPVFTISALAHTKTDALCKAILAYLENQGADALNADIPTTFEL